MNSLSDLPWSTCSTTELREALQNVLGHYFGEPCQIVKLERRPAANYSSYRLEELDVHCDNDNILQLMFKDVSRTGLLQQARYAKPRFIYDPLREIHTYRTILANQNLGTTTYYGCVIDPLIGRYWLFIERVLGQELYQAPFSVWQEVAVWLAHLHAHFMDDELLIASHTAHLLDYNIDFYRLWMHRARRFLADRSPTALNKHQAIEWLASCYERVIERLANLPRTVIHGEFYASNILVQETAATVRVCPVDWEMAARGPGLIDLAALTSGAWKEEERQTLAMHYRAALPIDCQWRLTPKQFLDALNDCRFHIAIQWLGWSSRWAPPAEHAYDWLSEALELAERLVL